MLGQSIVNEFNEKRAQLATAAEKRARLVKGDVYLYVLRLRSPPGEPQRYYVGSAVDYEERLSAHYAGSGAAFTRRYPPVELIELRRGDRFDEDSMTRRLMAEHGIEYVRGGAYSRVVLTPEDVATVQHEIWAAAGLCVNCGKPKHFAVNCMAPTAAQAAHAAAHVAAPMAAQAAVHTASSTQPEVIIEKCDRCGRYGHAATECRTKVENINCKNCHKRGHRTEACRSAPVESHKIIYTCFRCGYHGHTSNVCTSKFDLDGEKITIYNKYYPKTGYVPSDRLSWRKTDTTTASSSDAATSNDSDESADESEDEFEDESTEESTDESADE